MIEFSTTCSCFYKQQLLSISTFCLCEMRLRNGLSFCTMVGVAQSFKSLKFHLLQFSPSTGCLGLNGVFVSLWLSDSVIIMLLLVSSNQFTCFNFLHQLDALDQTVSFFLFGCQIQLLCFFIFFKVVHLLQFSLPTGCLESNVVFFSVWLSDSVIMFFYFLQGSSHVSISDTSILLLK